MIQDIFKVPLYISKCDVDNTMLLNYVNRYVTNNPKGRKASNAGGYQSLRLDYEDGPVKILLDKIIKEVYNFGVELKIKSPLTLESIWFNINKQKESNMLHNHSGIISGVYYLKTHKNCGGIRFYHGYHDQLVYTWRQAEWKEYDTRNSEHWDIEPENNDLILFPSYLNHSVAANESTEDRISFSFNFFKT